MKFRIFTHLMTVLAACVVVMVMNGTAVAITPKITAGINHTVVLKNDGTLWAWGRNYIGQLGDGTTTDSNVPTRIGTGSTWSAVAAGYEYTVALKSDGTLWAWGLNSSGQLGDGTTVSKNVPTQIGNSTIWSAVAACAGYTVALKSDGTLWSWGDNGRKSTRLNSSH